MAFVSAIGCVSRAKTFGANIAHRQMMQTLTQVSMIDHCLIREKLLSWGCLQYMPMISICSEQSSWEQVTLLSLNDCCLVQNGFATYVAEALENFWRVNKQSQWFKEHPILHDEPCQCVSWRAGTRIVVCIFLGSKIVVEPNLLRILIYGTGFLWWSMEMIVMHTGDDLSMW